MATAAATISSIEHGQGTPLAMAFTPVAGLAEAEAYTRKLAHEHYENFSVVSMLLPKRLRQDFCNIYAFCRTADDLGDETGGDTAKSLEMLGRFKEMTRECYQGRAQTAVFVALRGTIQKCDIPDKPFLDLIDAFEQDQRVNRYDTFAQVVDYCTRSADPVGRLVLYLCGYRDDERQRLSDKTCTALQLANFWQDVRRDLQNLNRIYLPHESMAKFGLSEPDVEQMVQESRCDDRARELIRFEVDRTQKLFDEGEKLLPLLDAEFRPQIALFGKGGRAILQAIRRRNYDTFTGRPKLSKWQKGTLVLGTLAAKLNPARLIARRGPA
jgi:squalene synthase HpnC